MNETDKNCRSMKQIIKDATDRELEKYETKELTPDELKAMVASARKKKKRQYSRLAGIAALFIIAVFGAAMAFSGLTSDVEADKNAKEEIVTEDGVIIEDGGWGSSTEDNWVITDWDEVAIAKAHYENLLLPQYIPKEFNFKKLVIQKMEKNGDFEYTFLDKKSDDLVIREYSKDENVEALHVEGDRYVVESSKGKIYLQNNSVKNKATIQMDDGIVVDIWCSLSDKEIIKIVENLNY